MQPSTIAVVRFLTSIYKTRNLTTSKYQNCLHVVLRWFAGPFSPMWIQDARPRGLPTGIAGLVKNQGADGASNPPLLPRRRFSPPLLASPQAPPLFPSTARSSPSAAVFFLHRSQLTKRRRFSPPPLAAPQAPPSPLMASSFSSSSSQASWW